MLTCDVLLSHILLFMVLPLDSIMVSKHKGKSNNETKKSCKVMTLDEKVNILSKLHSGMNTAAVGLTVRWYFILKSGFPLIFYCNV
jgi:hypothetical protein